jgi:hypothetical protein
MIRSVLIALTLALFLGCGSEPAPPPSPPTAPPKGPDAPPPPLTAAPDAAKSESPPAETKQPAPPIVKGQAQVGVGKAGHYEGDGPVVTPIATYFRMKEAISFTIQIPHAMNLYKAMEGHAPKTHEEFMEKIIKPNGIKLPELPEGERYLYDPKTEQLMVVQPRP